MSLSFLIWPTEGNDTQIPQTLAQTGKFELDIFVIVVASNVPRSSRFVFVTLFLGGLGCVREFKFICSGINR